MSFTFDARTLLELGKELISTDEVALYELIKNAVDAGSPRVEIVVRSLFSESFTWCSRGLLTELERPERMEEIERNWEASEALKAARRVNLPLSAVLAGAESEEVEPEGCLICSL